MCPACRGQDQYANLILLYLFVILSFTFSHIQYQVILVNLDLFHAASSSSYSCSLSRSGICCWTAVLLMPGSIAESLPRALASINTTAGNQRGQRERPHTKTCNAPATTSGRFVFSCIHTHFRAVCVGVCCQLLKAVVVLVSRLPVVF